MTKAKMRKFQETHEYQKIIIAISHSRSVVFLNLLWGTIVRIAKFFQRNPKAIPNCWIESQYF